MTAQAALAVANAGVKIIGGFIEAANARARAQYLIDLQQEQADLYAYMANKQITQETGTANANVGGRGIANTGSVSSSILQKNFDNQLEMQAKLQSIQQQIEQDRLKAFQVAQDAITKGFTGALGGLSGSAASNAGGAATPTPTTVPAPTGGVSA